MICGNCFKSPEECECGVKPTVEDYLFLILLNILVITLGVLYLYKRFIQ